MLTVTPRSSREDAMDFLVTFLGLFAAFTFGYMVVCIITDYLWSED